MKSTTLEYFVRRLQYDVEKGDTLVEEFTAKVKSDPHYALSWSEKYFDQVASSNVAKGLLRIIEKAKEDGKSEDETLAYIRNRLFEELVRKSSSSARSTMTTSNLMAQSDLMAVGRWVETLNGL